MGIKISALRKIALWVAGTFLLGAVFLGGFVEPLVSQTLQDHGIFKRPETWVWSMIIDLIYFVASKWFYAITGGFTGSALGFACGVWIDTVLRRKESSGLDSAEKKSPSFIRTALRLRFTGILEPPHSISEENIKDWYIYWTPPMEIRDSIGNVLFKRQPSWLLFINFEKPTSYHQLMVNFTGGHPESKEVRRSLTTSVVITLEGMLPACEMEVVTRWKPIPPYHS